MEWSSSGRSGLGPGRLVLTARAVRNARDAQRNPDHADTSAGGGQRAGSRKRLERALRLGSLGQAGQQQVSLRPTRQTSSMPGLSLLSSLSQSLHSPHPPPPIGLSLSNPLLHLCPSLSFFSPGIPLSPCGPPPCSNLFHTAWMAKIRLPRLIFNCGPP